MLPFCQNTSGFCRYGTVVFRYTDAVLIPYRLCPRAVSEDIVQTGEKQGEVLEILIFLPAVQKTSDVRVRVESGRPV